LNAAAQPPRFFVQRVVPRLQRYSRQNNLLKNFFARASFTGDKFAFGPPADGSYVLESTRIHAA
jgi:hypothetical protein